MEADRLKLYDKIDSLFGTICDIDLQQRAHNLAINRLEQGRTKLSGEADHETITDARLRATDGLASSPRRHPQGSPAALVVDLRSADRDALMVPRSPADSHYAGRGSVPDFSN